MQKEQNLADLMELAAGWVCAHWLYLRCWRFCWWFESKWVYLWIFTLCISHKWDVIIFTVYTTWASSWMYCVWTLLGMLLLLLFLKMPMLLLHSDSVLFSAVWTNRVHANVSFFKTKWTPWIVLQLFYTWYWNWLENLSSGRLRKKKKKYFAFIFWRHIKLKKLGLYGNRLVGLTPSIYRAANI